MKRILLFFLTAAWTVSCFAQLQIKNSENLVLVTISNTGNVGIGLEGSEATARLQVAGVTNTRALQVGGSSTTSYLLRASDTVGNVEFGQVKTASIEAGAVIPAHLNSINPAQLDKVLAFDGAQFKWVNAGSGISINAATGALAALNASNLWNANKLQNYNIIDPGVTNGTPTEGDMLVFKSGQWQYTKWTPQASFLVYQTPTDGMTMANNGVNYAFTLTDNATVYEFKFTLGVDNVVYANFGTTFYRNGATSVGFRTLRRNSASHSTDLADYSGIAGQTVSSDGYQSYTSDMAPIYPTGVEGEYRIYCAKIGNGNITLLPYIVGLHIKGN
jgi:hypothetical protein